MLYGLKLALIGVITLPATFLTILLGLFDPLGKRVYRIGRVWSWTILKISGVSLNVRGLNQLDPRRQYLFMANHQSNIDIPVLMESLPGFQLRWIAKKELLRVPFFGWAMWAAKHIIVDRSSSLDAARSLRKAKRRIKAGISVVIFPEGTRSKDGRLLPFKKGGFLLALQTGTPIVPVTISGSGRVLRPGGWRLQRGTIDVTIGEAIAVDGSDLANVRTLSARVRKQVETSLRQPAREPGTASSLPPENSVIAGSIEKHST